AGRLAATAVAAVRSSAIRPANRPIGLRPKSRARRPIIIVPLRAESELDLRWRLRCVACGKFRHWLVAAGRRRSPDHARKGTQLSIVGAHRLDIVAPRHRDAVLGPFKLRLKRKEVLIGLQ